MLNWNYIDKHWNEGVKYVNGLLPKQHILVLQSDESLHSNKSFRLRFKKQRFLASFFVQFFLHEMLVTH